MIEDLVVIASHGDEHIDSCLMSLGEKYEILVLDDCPAKYTTGKYLWAYWNHPAKNYFFMQDSMEALQEDYLKPFKEKMPEKGAVSWAYFEHPDFDSKEQRDWAEYLYPGGWDGKGIFGPVFYTSRESLDYLTDRQLLPPTPMNKRQAQGSERLWAMAFNLAGLPAPSVGGRFNPVKMNEGEFPVFKKTWADRQ